MGRKGSREETGVPCHFAGTIEDAHASPAANRSGNCFINKKSLQCDEKGKRTQEFLAAAGGALLVNASTGKAPVVIVTGKEKALPAL
ncbi:MAG: hypothetical protein ACTSX7_19720 [Alphaproteobacteria bacterium]